MADPTMQQVLARVGALEGQLARYERRRRRARRLIPLLTVALLVALAPLAVLAVTPFTDLTGGVHDANIDAIYQAGVTRGCVPDAEYCPTAGVTREEMASFLARLGGLGTNPPVANAKTAQTATSATTVGGYAPNGLVRVARGDGSANVALAGIAPSAYQTVAQVTLDSPAAGFVFVHGAVSLETGSNTCDSADFFACAVYLRLRDTSVAPGPDPANPAGVSPQLYALVNLTAHFQSVSPAYVFPVGAGARTFVLEAGTLATYVNQVQVRYPTVIALYVPFGPTGGTTLDLP
jgi:hypothetical protein